MATAKRNPNEPRSIKASEFKAKCLKLMEEVAESGEEIVITRNGRPTVRLVAYRAKFEEFFGADKGKLEIIGDIISPIDVDWEVDTVPDSVLFPDTPRYPCITLVQNRGRTLTLTVANKWPTPSVKAMWLHRHSPFGRLQCSLTRDA